MNETLRVLDLGSHDGFVTTWLARQLREKDVDVIVHGVEANPDAVRIANERLKNEGIVGMYAEGLAEDAPTIYPDPHFPRYDAVVAFELIEHVPDVDAFLSVCEHMCAFSGRIYLSTPNGTFGEGQNPHHLRVYKAVDLFDLCRKRGHVVDLEMGHDGVTVISYAPHSTERCWETATVHTGGGWEAWDPDDIETRGLGGSETAAVHVADALSEQGYSVTVYGEFREPVMRRQVIYRHHSLYDPLEPTDLSIISRQPQVFDRPIESKRAVLWMHDTDYGDAMTPERVEKMDDIFVLSKWHKRHVLEMYPFIDEWKVAVTRNGIDPERFPLDMIPPTEERPHRAIYSSSPDRGLDHLLRLWPRVRDAVPDAELVYCYGAVYDAVAAANPRLAAFRSAVQELSEQDGVTNLGPLDQFSLAGAMAKCRVWLAPSWCTPIGIPFHETYCIGAVEAAAAGCRRVVSDWGALVERASEDPTYTRVVRAPQSLDGSMPDPPIDDDEWVADIVDYLTMNTMCPPSPHAHSQTWHDVAEALAG